jgi:hypothetical protein
MYSRLRLTLNIARIRLRGLRDSGLFLMAGLLPKRLRYFVVLFGAMEATTGRYNQDDPTRISVMELLRRIDPDTTPTEPTEGQEGQQQR